MNRARAGLRAAVLVVALAAAMVTAPHALADPVGGIEGRQDVKRASEVLQEHAGDFTAGIVGAGAAAGFCSTAAPGCGVLVGLAAGSYYEYAAAINNAARHGACLKVFFGDDVGEISGAPYVGEYDGVGCREQGETELTDPVMGGG